jgi:hypothetical protein
MESRKTADSDLEAFRKLEERLMQVKRYRENNSKRINILRDELKRVKEHMDDVNKQQNIAMHKIISGRRS